MDYRTSYSHRGRYYTLDELVRFDELGLWSFRSVWFSRFGTLVATVEALVGASEVGFDAAELERAARGDKAARHWTGRAPERLARTQLGGRYVYVSADPSTRRPAAGRPPGL